MLLFYNIYLLAMQSTQLAGPSLRSQRSVKQEPKEEAEDGDEELQEKNTEEDGEETAVQENGHDSTPEDDDDSKPITRRTRKRLDKDSAHLDEARRISNSILIFTC